MVEVKAPQKPVQSSFWFALIALTVARLLFASFSGLKVEEAYYWNYSQHPALSYFDHPPLTAWCIQFSTWIGGHTPFWVRLPALAFFAGTAVCWYSLARQLFDRQVAVTAVFLLYLLPAFGLVSNLMLPDAPLLFFWSLGIWAGWKLVSSGDPSWWWVVGIATGLGLDSKYPALLIPAGLLLFLFLQRQHALIFCRSFWGAACLALLAFAPVILWNAAHNWASFWFQGASRLSEAIEAKERVASWLFQVGMLTPPGFLALAAALVYGWRRRDDARFAYLLCASVPFLALMVLVSTRRLVQINWPLPGYIGATIILAEAWSAMSHRYPRAARVYGLLFLFFAMPVALLPLAQTLRPVSELNSADDLNGWKPMASRALQIRNAMPNPERTFLAGHGYQCASQLAFHTGQPQVLANNILGETALSFDYWDSPSRWIGHDAVYVTYQTAEGEGRFKPRVWLDVERLRSVFESVAGPEELVVRRGGGNLRRYLYYRCHNYRGPSLPAGKERAKLGQHDEDRIHETSGSSTTPSGETYQ